MSLNTINQYALAIELISLGARTKIVAKETGLSPKTIRQAIEDMHGQSAPSGSLKTSPQFISKSFSRLKEGTLYVFFFRIEKTMIFVGDQLTHTGATLHTSKPYQRRNQSLISLMHT